MEIAIKNKSNDSLSVRPLSRMSKTSRETTEDNISFLSQKILLLEKIMAEKTASSSVNPSFIIAFKKVLFFKKISTKKL